MDLARALKALHTVMAKNDVRYYLKTLHIVRNPSGNFFLEATDGHRAARITLHKNTPDIQCTEEEADFPVGFLAERPAIDIAVKMMPAKPHNVSLVFGQDSAHINVQGSKIQLTKCEGRFPDLNRIIDPAKKFALSGKPQEGPVSYNAAYLKNMADFFLKLRGTSKFSAVKLWPAPENNAGYVQTPIPGNSVYMTNIEYLIMPMRDDAAERSKAA